MEKGTVLSVRKENMTILSHIFFFDIRNVAFYLLPVKGFIILGIYFSNNI
jgi:hypothetical protein